VDNYYYYCGLLVVGCWLWVVGWDVTLIYNVNSFAQESLAKQKTIALDFMSYVLIQFGIIKRRPSLSAEDITPIRGLDKYCFTLALAAPAIYALCNSSAETSHPDWSCRTHHKKL
jgi:hypothetical protein